MENKTRSTTLYSGARRLVTGATRSKAKGLLNMLYTTAELSDILGVTRRALIDQWISEGLPYTQDAKRRYWFNGKAVAAWVAAYKHTRDFTIELGEGMALCLHCMEPVEMIDPKAKDGKRTQVLSGKCPQCGKGVTRFNGTRRASW